MEALSKLLSKLFYFRMRKRIKALEENINNVDYPIDIIQRNPVKWNKNYIGILYEWSVNGARSRRAINHLDFVTNTVYAFRLLLVMVLLLLCCGLLKK